MEGLSSPVVVCESCGLGSIFPQPTPEEIVGFYPQDYYGETGAKFEPLVEAMVRLVGARHVGFLSEGLSPGARVLDVGCGRGVLLTSFADRGFEIHGIEMCEAAIEGADPRAQIQIVHELAAAKYPDQHFDRVVIWHVLEHLPNPRETMQEIYRILKPGGRVVVAVPNFSSLQSRWARAAWFHLDLPRHLFHFPVAALGTLLENTGFRCLSTHHFSLRQNPFGWVQSQLNKFNTFPRNSLYVLLQRGTQLHKSDLGFWRRLRLRIAYFVGMPGSLVISVIASWFRSGATVHIVAEKPDTDAAAAGDT